MSARSDCSPFHAFLSDALVRQTYPAKRVTNVLNPVNRFTELHGDSGVLVYRDPRWASQTQRRIGVAIS